MPFFRSSRGAALLAGLLIVLILRDYRHLARTNPFFVHEDPHSLSGRLAKIRPGVTREDVEKLLAQRGIELSGKTRYTLVKNTVVDVSYDAAGGSGSPLNKVSMPIEITEELFPAAGASNKASSSKEFSNEHLMDLPD